MSSTSAASTLKFLFNDKPVAVSIHLVEHGFQLFRCFGQAESSISVEVETAQIRHASAASTTAGTTAAATRTTAQNRLIVFACLDSPVMTLIPRQRDLVALVDGYAERQCVIAGEVEHVQVQRLIDALRRDINQELTWVRICRLLDVRADPARRCQGHTGWCLELELDRSGFVIPMHLVQRIQMKTEIHRTRAIREDTRIAVGADLDIEGYFGTLNHRFDLDGLHAGRFLDPRHDALGHCRWRWLSRQIKVRDGCGILHRADEAFQIAAQLARITPRTPCDDNAFGIDHEFAVGRSSHGLMKHVVHGVGKLAKILAWPLYVNQTEKCQER